MNRSSLTLTVLLSAALPFALVADSAALTNLVAGKRLVAKDAANPKSDKLVFKYVGDPGLFTLDNPLCPAQSKLRIVDSNEVHAEITLDCNDWSVSGPGYKYKETPGGSGSLRKIRYGLGRLIVTIKGSPYDGDPVTGPVDFVETRLTIGSTEVCGRWEAPPSTFTKNGATISAKGPTTACIVQCGNSILEVPEQCDDGDLVDGDGCDSNCTLTVCGNGVTTAGEDCDDGNLDDGDGCRSDCTVEECGDGVTDPDEECDDGNVANGDCCDSSCDFETAGSSCPDEGNVCTDDVCNGAGVCGHANNTATCDDANGCTLNDSCQAGSCGGELRLPWINEFDYDDVTGDLFNDRDEFIEIAGPAGLDLSGYRVVVVEGSGSGCSTGGQAAGTAYINAPIPNGTVLADAGNGVGFLVVCFTSTSTSVGANCDVTLAGTATDSNLKNGQLTNADLFSCPDGILLLDPANDFVDAVSYEGIVANTGAFGPFFHPPFISPAYSAERDEGWLTRVAIEKTTNTLERAQNASEWRDPTETGLCSGQGGGLFGFLCANNTATPGVENPTQNLECGSPCEAFLDAPAELVD